MHESVLVVVANKRYLDPAKAVFFGAHDRGEWPGDMALVAFPDVSEEDAQWFTSRGIEVMRFDTPVPTEGLEVAQAAQFHKLNVFRTAFKKWKRVVYLDCDILLLGSLVPLLSIDTQGGIVVDGEEWPEGLASQFAPEASPELFAKLGNEVEDLSINNFNTSSMVFETSTLLEDTYDTMVTTLKDYQPILKNGDQPVINLYFYKRWVQLPEKTIGFFQSADAAEYIGLHFCNWNAPWQLKGTNIETMWLENLANANAAASLVRKAP